MPGLKLILIIATCSFVAQPLLPGTSLPSPASHTDKAAVPIISGTQSIRIHWQSDLRLSGALDAAGCVFSLSGSSKIILISGDKRTAVIFRKLERKEVPDPLLKPDDRIEILGGY